MRVLICGSRTWPRGQSRLIGDRIAALPSSTVVITGGARGVDQIADEEARHQRLSRIVVPANWERHRKAAGPIRNQLMLDLGPQLVIAFRAAGESRGTDDMVDRAEKAGVPVEVIHQATAA